MVRSLLRVDKDVLCPVGDVRLLVSARSGMECMR